jgi:hypothetical protein
MFLLIKVDGLFRRVLNRSAMAGGSSVEVVVGFRERRSGSASSPGPGWRRVVGESRSWMKREPRTEERFVKDNEVMEVSDWPTGIKEHGFTNEHYEAILMPSITAGVEATGAIGLRKCPDVKVGTLEVAIKEAGLAMPTDEEFTALVESLWTRTYKPAKKPPTLSNLITGGLRKKIETPVVDQKAEAPKVETPVVEQKIETPVVEQKIETPVVEQKIETPVVEMLKVESTVE